MKHLRKIFLAGLFTILPLAVTFFLIYWLVSKADAILRTPITSILGTYIPGLGFFTLLAVIFLTGLLTNNLLGRWVMRQIEKILNKLPIIKNLYGSISDIQKTFSDNPSKSFSQVALIDYPLKGTKSMGFIANKEVHMNGELYYSVFVPTAPNPTNGFLLFLKEDEIELLDIPVDVAIKMVISMGTFKPEKLMAGKKL